MVGAGGPNGPGYTPFGANVGNDDAGSANKNIALTASVRSNLTFNDDRELKEVCGAYQAAVGGMDKLGEESGFGFPKKMATSAEVSRII